MLRLLGRSHGGFTLAAYPRLVFLPEVSPCEAVRNNVPGEKLYEELVVEDETAEPFDVREILKIRPRWQPESAVPAQQVAALEALTLTGAAVLSAECWVGSVRSKE